MPGLILITLTALLTSCDAFRLGWSQRVIPLSSPLARLFQDEGQAQPHFIQELVRTKRHSVQDLVRAQPHLVHDMGWPEVHETPRSQAKMDATNSSQLNAPLPAGQEVARTRPAVDDNLDVEDEMERMVHLAVPQEAESYRGRSDSIDPERELLVGPGAGDASLEASGFYGTDMEDRDRGDEGGEDRQRRGGEDGEEGGEDRERRGGEDGGDEGGEDRERRGGEKEEKGKGTDNVHVLDANHTTPDLDALIGYSPSSSPPAQGKDSGLQEHRGSPVQEVGPIERDLWETEEDNHSSGYGVLQSSISPSSTTATSTVAGGDAAGTATPETDTGTDFGLLGSYTTDETEDEEAERKEEEEEDTGLLHKGAFTQNPTVAEVGVAPSREPLQPSVEEEEQLEEEEQGVGLQDRSEEMEEERWRKMEEEEEEARIRHIIPLTTYPSWLEKTTPLQTQRSEVRGGGVTEVRDVDELEEARQVVCVDWSELLPRGYVVFNLTDNFNCAEFRVNQGVRLLKVIERVFARRMNSPEGSWVLYLSKPHHQQHQLLVNVAYEKGVINTKDVLGMLGEIRKSLMKVGVENFGSASSCHPRPSQTRSDYGKLFVVLVIIGSVCMVIITSGFIYICWQRRLPATKTTFRAEELHFVENGCHDNPTLDVTNDNQPEMQEKKPSTNGLAGGGDGGGEESSRWQVFVNQAATEEEEEEQDTHL